MSNDKSHMEIESEATLIEHESQKEKEQSASVSHSAANASEAEKPSDKKVKKTKKKKTRRKTTNSSAEKTIEKAAGAAGAAIMGLAAEEVKTKEGRKRLAIIGGVAAIIAVVGFLIFKPQIMELLGIDKPQPVAELSEQHSLTHSAIDFQNAVLGESRSKKDLIVLEQDVKVDSKISQKMLDMSVFKKTKKIHSYGAGVYTVDLSKLTADDIRVDQEKKTVTVTIPRTTLQYVNIDVKKTEFEDTKKGILGFGDIKFTQEQQKALEESIDSAMRDILDTEEMFKKADETAVTQVDDIFSPLIKSVADDYDVAIVQ